jgi:thiol-disulfide isomerase/thioredoxin
MPSPRRWTQLLLWAALVVAISGCKKRAPVPEGDILATLTIPLANDQPFDPASLRGKPTLVLFATPTCPYCADELPIADRVAQSENANLVAVYISGSKDQATSVTRSLGFTGPVLVDDGTLRKRYEIKGVPYTLVLGPDGHATEAFRGLQDEATLRNAVADAR